MAVSQKNTARVRVEAQERLDLPDFLSLQDQGDDGLQLTIGALMGPGGGCLSPFHVLLSNNGGTYFMAPTTFQFYWAQHAGSASDDGTYRAWRGGVTLFDPLAEGQQTLLDYTAQRTAGSLDFLYARPKAVDGAVDGRRKFIGGAAISTSLKTRTRIVVEFKFSLLAPSDTSNDGWAPVAKIASWTANVPALWSISAWDAWAAYAQAQQGTNFWEEGQNTTNDTKAMLAIDDGSDAGNSWEDLNGGANNERSFGLGAMLMQIRARIRRHLAKDGTRPWYYDPARDLKVLDANLATAEASLVALAPWLTQPYIKAAGFVKYTAPAGAGSYGLVNTPPMSAFAGLGTAPFGSLGFVRLGVGIVRVDTGINFAVENILNVVCNTIDAAGDQITILSEYAAVLAPTVLLRDPTNAYVDSSFFITIWCRKL